ncbi:hypothetical protein [Aeromicrobium sp. 179-A 4D2 NHS]|uniref:hypothetical protein n=1 Tax=Aeromicrobium sp. 179-A 4D2 NHS TaxID=3142375 RepID=UPI0039A00F62
MTITATVVTPAGVNRDALEADIRECLFTDADTEFEVEAIADMLIEKGWVGARSQPVFVPETEAEAADWARFGKRFFPARKGS